MQNLSFLKEKGMYLESEKDSIWNMNDPKMIRCK